MSDAERPVPDPAPPQGAAAARRILANTGFRTVADVGSKVATLALYVIMARELGPAQFGVFTFSMTLMMLVAITARLGQPTLLTREVARERERVHPMFWNTLAVQAATSLPVLAAVLLLAPLFGMDGTALAVTALLGVAILGEALMATLFAVMQAHERMGFVPVVLISQRWLIGIGGSAAVLAGAGVVTVSAIYLAGTAVGLVLGWTALSRRIVRPRFELDRRRWWPMMRIALPIGLAGMFSTLLFRLDIVLLGAFEPDAVVGQYGAAFRVFEGTLFLTWAAGTALYPVFSRLSARSEPPVRVVVERGLKLALVLVMPLGAGAVVLSGPVIELLYGDQYERAELALALLGPALAVFPVAYVCGQLLVSQDRQGELLWINVALTVQNVSFNLVLIQLFSLHGAAAASAVTQLLAGSLALWRTSVVCEGLDLRRAFAGPLSGSVAAAGAMVALHATPVLAVVAGGVTYLVVLLAVEHLAYPDDARLVRAILTRRGGHGLADPAGA